MEMLDWAYKAISYHLSPCHPVGFSGILSEVVYHKAARTIFQCNAVLDQILAQMSN